MKKYNFIVGLGTGLILSSLSVFLVYNFDNKDIIQSEVTQEKIVDEAKKLGMIFVSELPEINQNTQNSQAAEDESAAQKLEIQTDKNELPQENRIDKQKEQIEKSEIKETEKTESEQYETPKNEIIAEENANSPEILIDIPKGASSYEIVSLLKSNSVIDDEKSFNEYLTNKNSTKILKYGEHKFTQNMSFEEVLNIIIK